MFVNTVSLKYSLDERFVLRVQITCILKTIDTLKSSNLNKELIRFDAHWRSKTILKRLIRVDSINVR